VLIGSAIGNGWVDPYDQYPEYVTFALENKLINNETGEILTQTFKICQQMID